VHPEEWAGRLGGVPLGKDLKGHHEHFLLDVFSGVETNAVLACHQAGEAYGFRHVFGRIFHGP
jgi:hypothetical protein